MKYITLEMLGTFTQKLATKITDIFVKKEPGKGLSTNDYSTSEKTKLSRIATDANNYSHPNYTARTSGLYKVSVDNTGHVTATTTVTKEDITSLGIPGQSNSATYSDMKGATASAEGAAGLVPAPKVGQQTKFLRGDGTWGAPSVSQISDLESATENDLDDIIAGLFSA